MENGRWRWLTALVLATGAITAAGCGDDEDTDSASTATTAAKTFAAGTTMKKLQDAGEMTIGVKFDVPPFGFKDTSGEVQGFDIDLAKAIADELGVTPKYVEALSDNRIAFLKDGTADAILSTMTITAERDEEIDFSKPYFVAKGRILVKKDNTDINGVDDLAGKTVCTALGSTYEETLKKQAPKAKLRLPEAYSECLELIQNGSVDAVSTDDVILTGMIRQDDSLKLVGDDLTTEPYGVGVKEGDKAFQEFVNGVIDKYEEDGSWETAYQKWVGQYTGEKQEPPTMTLQEALDLSK
jgi:glutamate transport system substrate-binding protein